MKLHHTDDQLVSLLSELSEKATPGPWIPSMVRLPMQGPLMSYLRGDRSTDDGMTVTLGSERVADHQFVAALVNAWREGRLIVAAESRVKE